jgi:hypothetical protein
MSKGTQDVRVCDQGVSSNRFAFEFSQGIYIPSAKVLADRRHVSPELRGLLISVLEFKGTEYGRAKRVVANEEVKNQIRNIGINRCARESGFDRKNFIRKLLRDIPVKRNSYNEFERWLQGYRSKTSGVIARLRIVRDC